ncbi:MAG: hypothetical protein M3P96_02120 [Actinomycetota bacterium]|nr:hypothetical protein [Actinomycetota bacterium]
MSSPHGSTTKHTHVRPNQALLAEVTRTVRRSAAAGLGHVSFAELERWVAELHAAQDAGEFLFAETAFLVTAGRAR